MRREVQRFLEEHTTALQPLHVESRLAFWEARTTGSEEAARRAGRLSAEVRKLYSDPAALERIREWLRRGDLDALTRRQLVLLEKHYTANQLPAELIEELEERARAIEHTFATFRARVGGGEVSDNRIREILETEADTALRREAWEASKAVGSEVAAPLRALARRRNHAARTLGFSDFYAMELVLQEIGPDVLDTVVADVESRTEQPFTLAKTGIDRALARRLGIAPEALRPWHYADPFFQEPPPVHGVDLDPLFASRDVVALSRRYYAAVGLPVDSVLERSDLYERPGKDQHAFCIDMDRTGDVRVLCNVRNNARWMGIMLHELGHAAYDLYLPESLPFLLRAPAHTLTTEAVAMFFGARSGDAGWLGRALELPPATRTRLEAELPARRARELLVFARWAMVMIRFERAFYSDPDRQDLNAVWWELVGRLQRLHPPERQAGGDDWASKIHLAVAPVYYHNYLLGELFAAQLRTVVEAEGAGGDLALGELFRRRVFGPGASVAWDALVESATGEPLSARHFGAELQRTLGAL